jgi:hypothetical protein
MRCHLGSWRALSPPRLNFPQAKRDARSPLWSNPCAQPVNAARPFPSTQPWRPLVPSAGAQIALAHPSSEPLRSCARAPCRPNLAVRSSPLRSTPECVQSLSSLRALLAQAPTAWRPLLRSPRLTRLLPPVGTLHLERWAWSSPRRVKLARALPPSWPA